MVALMACHIDKYMKVQDRRIVQDTIANIYECLATDSGAARYIVPGATALEVYMEISRTKRTGRKSPIVRRTSDGKGPRRQWLISKGLAPGTSLMGLG